MTIKIKEFMAMYGILDIKMRMLRIEELLRIQGFPAGYVLKGTVAAKKKFIGNSVETTVACKIAEANAYANIGKSMQAV
jgi:DNA (cytosine-5)-methyltransferase 1